MQKDDRIYVAGHTGLVGSALVRQLSAQGYRNVVTRTRAELDLMQADAVAAFFREVRPAFVFMAAGKTGGLYANNTYRADFLYENMIIQSNLMHQAFLGEVRKLMYFGCSCMYPKFAPQPMKEESLLSGALEPTNEPFAVAKLAGWKMCESYNRQYGSDFVTVIPTNVYGLNQDYTPLNSLVIPALIARFHEAKAGGAPEAVVWGSGRPSRDFLFADDLADAAIFLMNNYSADGALNVGSGRDITIKEAAETIAAAVGYRGRIVFDAAKPEGVLVKLQDVSRMNAMGWRPKMEFAEGIRLTYQDYLKNIGA